MEEPNANTLITTVKSLIGLIKFILVFFVILICILIFGSHDFNGKSLKISNSSQDDFLLWQAPDITSIQENKGNLIKYGRELILFTSYYLGPAGKVRSSSNGMNCTNCHLNGGTKPFGNNFSAVASTYPKFKPRYGAIESIEMRVNDCFVRSLNGSNLDTASLEMKAIVAYIRWLGKDVMTGTSPPGSGLLQIPFLDRAADPEKGQIVYAKKCASCHGLSGEGILKKDSSSWLNPPLWGNQSYTIGAGIYRLGRFAAFVKANMPWGASHNAPQLSDEEAWDVAAYVNSLPRPNTDVQHDWPDISKKAIDYPFGPFNDSFSAAQHKYGPFKPILEFQKTSDSKKKGVITQ